MVITSYSDFRQKLKDYLDKVVKSHSPLFITRAKGESLVVLSQSDYESIIETFYLVKSPKNAQRLQSALNEFHQGKGSEHQLNEE